jgi:hypothetical protein
MNQAQFREFDTVRVVRLLSPTRRYDGTDGTKRPPAIGDVATIVNLTEESVSCEMVDDAGNTVWLADFTADELIRL